MQFGRTTEPVGVCRFRPIEGRLGVVPSWGLAIRKAAVESAKRLIARIARSDRFPFPAVLFSASSIHHLVGVKEPFGVGSP